MDPKVLSEYFKKCFLAVDGLWFMMLEKTDSFEKALEVDRMVWEILPKIQARKIKELFKMEGDKAEHLVKAIEFKLAAEDFVGQVQCEDQRIEITIKKCPWLALLRKSKREHLAEKIGDAICRVEYNTFAGEFAKGLDFDMIFRRCSGDQVCKFVLKTSQVVPIDKQTSRNGSSR
jgi:hypothetical protein